MSSTRKKLLRKQVVVSVGCGCRRPKLSDVFNWKPKPAKAIYGRRNQVYQASSSSSWEKATPARSIDNDDNDDDDDDDDDEDEDVTTKYHNAAPAPAAKRAGRVRESVAVVKESDDPYLDFRQSMLQMILEKEIYARDDLRELLNCFLSLNSPQHHHVIVRAFTEIWNGVYSAPRLPPFVVDVRSRSSRSRAGTTTTRTNADLA